MDVTQMVLDYRTGMTLKEVAARHSTSAQTVRRRLVAAGEPIRDYRKDRTAQRLAVMARSGYDDEELWALSEQGMTCVEIGQRIGRPEEAVRRAMVRRGIPRQEPKARPEKNHFWRGGMTVDDQGYVLVKTSGHPDANHLGYVRQHRLVMESVLGRPLAPGEVVDHRNGDTSDNRPENLRLFASNAEHLRATLTGRRKLSREDREVLRLEAVLRARRRVAAILAESGNGAPG